MAQAPVGDDCFGDDPSVRLLEDICAELFGKEAALFMASGTMSNQVALRALTSPGDEVITEERYHISYFESAQSAALSGVSLNTCRTSDGILRVDDVKSRIACKPRGAAYAQVSVVFIENTINVMGGKVFPLPAMKELYAYASGKGIKVHLDGGRIFNATLAAGVALEEYGKYCDTISACFSKGLGAPFGSILCADRQTIAKARRFRKWYGGALHQAGIMAAAALYALQHHYARLVIDHENARLLAALLLENRGLDLDPTAVETNMVYFDVSGLGISAADFARAAAAQKVLLFPWTRTHVRAATHLGIGEEHIYEAAWRLQRLSSQLELEALSTLEHGML